MSRERADEPICAGYYCRECLQRHRVAGFGAGQGGQPEVRQQHRAVLVQQQVRRFDVPVQDALGMGGRERVGDGGADLGDLLGWPRPESGADRPVAAVGAVLHHQVGAAVVRGAAVVQGEDVGVGREPPGGGRLADESATVARVDQAAVVDLHGDQPVDRVLVSPVHGGEPAVADLLQQRDPRDGPRSVRHGRESARARTTRWGSRPE